MKLNMDVRVIDIVIIVLLILSSITAGIMICNYSKYKEVATGIYFINNKTSLINMDRSWAEVMETCNHEYAHHTHYSHFQEDIIKTNGN